MMNMDFKQGLNATAFFNGDFYAIETCSGYRLLIQDYEGKQYLLTPDCTDQELGNAVINSLSVSRIVDPDDEDFFDRNKTEERYKEWVATIMEKYDYRTKKALFKKMHNCGICLLNDSITITPTNHDRLEGWSGERIARSDYIIIPAQSTPGEVGAALRLAFSRCKSKV